MKKFLKSDNGKYWIIGFAIGGGVGIIITSIVTYIVLGNYKIVWY